MRYTHRVLFPLAIAGALLGFAPSGYAAPGHGGGGHGFSGGGHGFSGGGHGFSGGGHGFSGMSHGFGGISHGFNAGPSFGGRAFAPSGVTRSFTPPARSFSTIRPSVPMRSFTPSHVGSQFHGQGSVGSVGGLAGRPGFHSGAPGGVNHIRPGAGVNHVGRGVEANHIRPGAVNPGVRHFSGGVAGNRPDGHVHGDRDHFAHHDFDHFHHHRFAFFFPLSVWPIWFPYGDDFYPYSSVYYPESTYEYAYPYTVYDSSSAYPGSELVYSGGAAETSGFLDQAVEAFRRGDYAEAFRLANHAAVDAPRDPRVPEVLSLALFAQGDYPSAAMAAHAALTLGPAADWTTLSGYYADVATYSRQLDGLAQYVRQNPGSPEGRFLLAYHDLMMGHIDAAKEQFAAAARLAPKDKIAQQVLDQLKGGAATASKGSKAY